MSGTHDDEGGYTSIDLDDPNPNIETDIEIVDGEDEAEQPVTKPDTVSRKPVAKQEDSDDDEPDTDADPEDDENKRKRLTRNQRLKAARDAYQAKLADSDARVKALEAEVAKYRNDATEGAAIGMDLYIQTLNDKMSALRTKYDAAFDSGDRNALWEVQSQMSEIAAEKKQAERERRAIPTKAGDTKSGGDRQPQTPPTTEPSPQPQGRAPDPRALEWASKHKDWFNVDRRMTRRAFVIDAEMQEEGFDSSVDSDYYEELDKRIRKEFPDKFGGATTAEKPNNPTLNSRPAAMAGGKVRVRITAEDRKWADQLGLTIQQYAKEKAKREAALQTENQYTEI